MTEETLFQRYEICVYFIYIYVVIRRERNGMMSDFPFSESIFTFSLSFKQVSLFCFILSNKFFIYFLVYVYLLVDLLRFK